MRVGDLVLCYCRNCVYCRAIPVSKSSLCTVYNRSTTLKDSCEHFANVAIKGNFVELRKRNKMADFNITDPEIIKMLKGLTEEGRQGVADQLQESLDSSEIKKISGNTDNGGNTETRIEEQIARLESQVPTKYAHTKENCVVYQEGGPPCPDCIETKDNHIEPSGVSLSQDGQKE